MPSLSIQSLLLPASLLVTIALASPAPQQAAIVEVHEARTTPSPVLHDVTKTYKRPRDIISEIGGEYSDILSYLGTDVPSFVISGIPQWFENIPTGSAVQSSLSLSDSALAALPTQALNIPPYANYTDQGWNVRFHGNIYKQPNVSESTLDDLANDFLIGTSIQDLPASQQDQARNVTAEIFVVQQGGVNVSNILVTPYQNGSGTVQNVTLPYETTPEGDFDVFVPINSAGLMNGNETDKVQRLATWVANTTEGNATAYLVPNQGLTVISDIDDILRITQIYDPKDGILNTFARPYVPWEDMPDIYANWSQSLPNTHFHYLTTLPEQVTRNYEQFIFDTYPAGSFDTRPLNFSDVQATLSIREYLLVKIFTTFPERKFVLVADTSNSDVMRDYPKMYHTYPNQVQCIFLRNTSATDSLDHFPYDTSGFKGIPQERYMFFVNADDLKGVDIAPGNSCYNPKVPQNLTYGYQNLPLGKGQDVPVNGSANNVTGGASALGRSEGLSFVAFVGLVFWSLF